jgi:hypothetical protein
MWAAEQETSRETMKIDAEAMRAGGASKSEVDQYNRWYEKWTNALLHDNDTLRNDTVFGASGFVLVIGRKK